MWAQRLHSQPASQRPGHCSIREAGGAWQAVIPDVIRAQHLGLLANARGRMLALSMSAGGWPCLAACLAGGPKRAPREFPRQCCLTSEFLLTLMGTLVTLGSLAVPGLPGAQKSCAHCSDCASFQVSACSRPPEPTTRTLTCTTADSITQSGLDMALQDLLHPASTGCLQQHV